MLWEVVWKIIKQLLKKAAESESDLYLALLNHGVTPRKHGCVPWCQLKIRISAVLESDVSVSGVDLQIYKKTGKAKPGMICDPNSCHHVMKMILLFPNIEIVTDSCGFTKGALQLYHLVTPVGHMFWKR